MLVFINGNVVLHLLWMFTPISLLCESLSGSIGLPEQTTSRLTYFHSQLLLLTWSFIKYVFIPCIRYIEVGPFPWPSLKIEVRLSSNAHKVRTQPLVSALNCLHQVLEWSGTGFTNVRERQFRTLFVFLTLNDKTILQFLVIIFMRHILVFVSQIIICKEVVFKSLVKGDSSWHWFWVSEVRKVTSQVCLEVTLVVLVG